MHTDDNHVHNVNIYAYRSYGASEPSYELLKYEYIAAGAQVTLEEFECCSETPEFQLSNG